MISGFHSIIALAPAALFALFGVGPVLALTIILVRRHAFGRDRAALCDALDRFASGDFQPVTLDCTDPELREVAQACDRLLPKVHTAIAALEWAARHDPMTDLLNSASFRVAVQSALASAPGQGALLVMRINELGRVNDSLGHAGGDQLLCAVADRLRLVTSALEAAQGEGDAAPAEPLTARLGGEEFAMFVPHVVNSDDIERLIRRLQRVVGEAVHVGARSLRVKLSVGAAMVGHVESQYDQLLSAADSAMARSRAEGPGGYMFYTAAMRRAADELLEKEIDLRRALERGEFCLHYQPQLNLKSGEIDAVEALIRWNHPTRGLVSPSEFIPFSETYGLIDDIGDWVLVEAVRTAGRWNRDGRPLRMSINVSPKQLYRIELIPMIRASLSRFGLPPELLEIEITEAAIMRHEDFSMERLEGLRRDGVSLALDDFGTGYSNLAQVMSLPMDRLKLDRSLIDRITTDPRQQVVAASMIRMASQLGFDVLAEGVEEQGQLDLLRLAGCGYIQGYLISPPLREADLLARLERKPDHLELSRNNAEYRLA